MKSIVALFVLYLLGVSAQAATIIPSFKGRLTNLTSTPHSELRITVGIHCENKVINFKPCGKTEKTLRVSSDGQFVVPKMKLDKKFGTYHILTLKVSTSATKYFSDRFVCPDSDDSSCEVSQFTEALKELALIQITDIPVKLRFGNGMDLDWYLAHRSILGWIDVNLEFRLANKVGTREPVRVRHLFYKDEQVILSPPPIVVYGYILNDPLPVHVYSHSPGIGQLYDATVPVHIGGKPFPYELTNPVLVHDPSKFYLNGDYTMRFDMPDRLKYFYEGTFRCVDGILAGSFIATTALKPGQPSPPHPFPGEVLSIAGTCTENQILFRFNHAGQSMVVESEQLVRGDLAVQSKSGQYAVLNIFKKDAL